MTKQWYKSKGLWLGILTCLIGSLDVVVTLLQQDKIETVGIVMTVLGVLKIWERWAKGDLK